MSKIKMEWKCPCCGAEVVDISVDDESWVDEDTKIIQSHWHCDDCGKRGVASEELLVISRLVARDDDELDALIAKEEALE